MMPQESGCCRQSSTGIDGHNKNTERKKVEGGHKGRSPPPRRGRDSEQRSPTSGGAVNDFEAPPVFLRPYNTFARALLRGLMECASRSQLIYLLAASIIHQAAPQRALLSWQL